MQCWADVCVLPQQLQELCFHKKSGQKFYSGEQNPARSENSVHRVVSGEQPSKLTMRQMMFKIPSQTAALMAGLLGLPQAKAQTWNLGPRNEILVSSIVV